MRRALLFVAVFPIVLAKTPHAGFPGRIRHVCVATASYAGSVALWAGSLAAVGIPREDVLAFCLGEHCDALSGEDFETRQVGPRPAAKCAASAHGPGIGCEIAVAKAAVLLGLLVQGDAVMFYDTDVYIFAHPLEKMDVQDPQADVYVSLDRASGKEKDRYNFGLFLVYPSAAALRFLEVYETEYLRQGKAWDQAVFGRLLARMGASGELKREILDGRRYAAVHMEVKASTFPPAVKGLVTLHGTCIEGERTKELAIFSSYLRPWLPAADLQRAKAGGLRTVTVAVEGEPIMVGNAAEADFFGRLLLTTAQKLEAKVRLNFQGYQGSGLAAYRLFSADAFEAAGVSLVEQGYWANFPEASVFRRVITVEADTPFPFAAVALGDVASGGNSDVVLDLRADALPELLARFDKGKMLADTESVVCGMLRQKSNLPAQPPCMQWCDAQSFGQWRKKDAGA